MTVISAVINRKCIAMSSDSLITYEDGNSYHVIEKNKSKIVRVEYLKSILSYWGYAATTSKMYGWTTLKFLMKMAEESHNCSSLKEFANYIKDQLTYAIGAKLKDKKQPIGIHLIGYSEINNEHIPEFYLITNTTYVNNNYSIGAEIKVKSMLFTSLPKKYRKWQHPTNENKISAIKEFLRDKQCFVFCDGDPVMFNPFFNAYFKAYRTAEKRNILNDDEVERARILAREPISCVANAQRILFKGKKRVVGGRVHDITIEKYTLQYKSSSKSAKIK